MLKDTIKKWLGVSDRTLGYTDNRMYNPGYIGWHDISAYYNSNKYDNVFPYIDLIASKFAAQDQYMVNAKGEKTAGDDPGSANLFSRLYYPNDRMSDYDLREAIAILALFDNRAMWRVHGKTTVRRGKKYILPQDITGFTPLFGVVTDVVGDEVIYRLPNNEELEYHQIIIDEDFNPEGFGLGYSPTKAAETWIDLDDYLACHQKGFFKNGAVAAGMYNIIAKSPQDFQDIKRGIIANHQGAGNNNNVMFNYTPVSADGKTGTGQIEWIPFNQQNKDLALKDLFDQVDKRIKQKFRVPPSMVGDSENNNLSSAQVDRKNFAIDMMEPFTKKRWSRWTMNLNRITGGFGGEIMADVIIPAISEEKKFEAETKQIDATTVTNLVTQGFTAESAIAYVKSGDIADLVAQEKEVNIVAPDTTELTDIPRLPETPYQQTKSLMKSISARDYPTLYEGTDINPDDLGCIMVDTEKLDIKKFVENADDDLVEATTRHEHAMGAVAEVEPHITLLYGLLENGNVWKDKVDQVLSGWELKTATIERVDYFETPDSYAVVAHIEKTPELVDGHERLTLLPHIQTFSGYKPHMTLAYINKEADVKKWVKALGAEYNGKKIKVSGINYGDKPEKSSKTLKKKIDPKDRNRFEQRLALAVKERMQAQVDKAAELIKSKAISEENPIDPEEDVLLTEAMLGVLLAFMQYQGDIEQVNNIRVMLNAGIDASDIGEFKLTGAQKAEYRKYVETIAKGYNDQTADRIRNVLTTGHESGASRAEMKKQLQDIVKEEWRVDRLTRTETQLAGGQSSVYSMNNIAKELGVKVYKVWQTNSGNPCEYCRAMEGKKVEVSANFLDYGDEIHGIDGGVMKNQWKDIDSAQSHSNCSCSQYYEVES